MLFLYKFIYFCALVTIKNETKMKKLLSFALVAGMFTFASCGGNETTTTEETATEETTETVEEVVEEAVETVEEVVDSTASEAEEMVDDAAEVVEEVTEEEEA